MWLIADLGVQPPRLVTSMGALDPLIWYIKQIRKAHAHPPQAGAQPHTAADILIRVYAQHLPFRIFKQNPSGGRRHCLKQRRYQKMATHMINITTSELHMLHGTDCREARYIRQSLFFLLAYMYILQCFQ